MKARYIRVSTSNQKVERQLVKKHQNESLFIDVVSGSIPFKDRPKGKEVLEEIENNNIKYISVHSIDRLGRNLFDILSTLEIFNEKMVVLKVDNLGIESLVDEKPNHAFKLIISVMANVAEMERESLLERQREGIAIAKLNGVYKGRVSGSVESDKNVLERYKNVVKQLKKGLSLRMIAKYCEVSLGTVQKVKSILKKQKILN
jgi:DNA invertase Pin-like site-specific DNA recombinase